MSEVLSPALDVRAFARSVLGFDLFEHQARFLGSPALYRVIVSGRQSGKSRAVATECLFRAATHSGFRVLLVSQGEEAALALLAEAASLAAESESLRGSVLDESRSLLVLSNGSTIKAVPASERQIRGKAIDLLCVDEGAFISPAIWQAAEPTIAARPGARVILASTPWGGVDHWFRQLFRRGMDAPGEWVESFHWPSTVSPLVSDQLVEHWRQTWPDYKFRTEILAEWADAVGTYFAEAEIEAAAADYELPDLDAVRAAGVRTLPAVGGVDYGLAVDANALVLVSPLDDQGLNERADDAVPLFVSHLEARHGWAWTAFIDRVVEVAGVFDVQVIGSERNGVGAMPSDVLAERVHAQVRGGKYGTAYVEPVWTDVRRKMSGYSKIKLLMQSGRLVIPRHAELLKQLRGLTFEQLPSGSLRIEVPAAAGHDDISDALLSAVSAVNERGLVSRPDVDAWLLERRDGRRRDPDEPVSTGAGLLVPRRPMPDRSVPWFAMLPQGAERGDGW